MKLGEWAERWLNLRRARLKTRTVEQYQDIISRYIDPLIGGCELENLSPLDVADVIAKAGTKERTAQLVYTILSAMMRAASRLDLIDRNPCEKIDKPRHEQHITEWWTVEQFQDFLMKDHDDQCMIAWLLAGLCGLRRGEIVGLRWSDIHDDQMHICNQRVRIKGTIIDTTPKTRTSDRWLPITPILRWYLDDRQRQGIGDYVLTDRHGQPLDPKRLDRYWKQAQQRAGVKNLITLHGLRHTMASIAVSQGINPRELQPVLGHASYLTTANIYTHIQQRQINGVVLAATRAVFGR